MFMLEVHAEREPAEAMAGLRRAMAASYSCGNPIRDEAYRLALSATVWRLIHFGTEANLSDLSARDLANFSLIAEGSLVETLARTGYSRAAVEGDQGLIDLYATLGIAARTQAWHRSLDQTPIDQLPGLLAGMEGEERHVARLLAGRRVPTIIEPSWLWDIPTTGAEGLPIVAYHLAALQLVARDDLRDSTSAYLARHREVLLCREPDDLLVPLVLRSSESPQTLLQPFTGLYGDPTITAAAAWHLEHRQPREAWALAHAMRPLSRHADDAWTIAGLAAVELGRLQDAEELRQRITGIPQRNRLLLALAEAQPEAVPVDRLAGAARDCGAGEPELFYRLLREIMTRKDLETARSLAAARSMAIEDPEPLRSILTRILAS